MANRTAIILRVGQAPEMVADFESQDLARMELVCGGHIDFFRPHPDAVRALEAELGVKLETGVYGWSLRVACRDDGHERELALNERATALYRGPRSAEEVPHYIVGDCVLLEVS